MLGFNLWVFVYEFAIFALNISFWSIASLVFCGFLVLLVGLARSLMFAFNLGTDEWLWTLIMSFSLRSLYHIVIRSWVYIFFKN